MGDFYGYNPSRFVMPDRYGIGAASQIASNTIMNVSGAVADKKAAAAKEAEKQETIRLGIEAAKKDWNGMSESYSGLGSSIRKKATNLVATGAITQAEADQLIDQFANLRPNSIYQKDPDKYLTMLGTTTANIYDTLNKKEAAFKGQRRQGDVTGAVKSAMEGTPGTPAIPEQTTIQKETIPTGQWAGVERPTRNSWGDEETQTTPAVPATQAVPPSRNESEAYILAQNKLESGNKSLATKEELENAGIKYQRDFTKDELNKDKVDIQKLRLAYSKEKDSNLNWYREEMARLANAKDEFTRSKHRDNLDAYADDLAEKILIAKNKRSELENQKDLFNNPIPVDPKAMVSWDTYIEAMEEAQKETSTNKKLKTIRQNVTTVPIKPPNVLPSEYFSMQRERPTKKGGF